MVERSLKYIKEFEKKYGPQSLWDGKSQAYFSVSDYYDFEKEYKLTQALHKDKERRARARGEIREADKQG
jgi:ribosomal protein S24E